jgi:hypothetical protein
MTDLRADLIRVVDDAGCGTAMADILRRALRDIPGVSGVSVVAKGGMATSRQADPYAPRISIGMETWSPTLHRIGMKLAVTEIEEACELDERMARRAADAAALGIERPLDVDMARIDHLHADASLVALSPDASASARHAVSLLHARETRGVRHGADVLAGDRFMREIDRPGLPALREVGWTIDLGSTPDGPSFDGRMLTFVVRRARAPVGDDLDARTSPMLPTTTLIGLPGRQLRSLVEVHPALDDRVVRRIEDFASTPGTRVYEVEFEPMPVPLG